ncbi:MAG TPA: hypothetical protein PKE06_08905 [Flavilitoribacter sp.]|nr:hypothetical protein [Flavilitoribacter sp.]HMQ88522.1 hypothetical protein [Flavilitoribacter sp.]
MSTQELRFSINRLVEQTEDPDILKSILILLAKSVSPDESNTIGFTIDEQPITEDELVASILEGKAEISQGIKIPFENLKKEFGIQ